MFVYHAGSFFFFFFQSFWSKFAAAVGQLKRRSISAGSAKTLKSLLGVDASMSLDGRAHPLSSCPPLEKSAAPSAPGGVGNETER